MPRSSVHDIVPNQEDEIDLKSLLRSLNNKDWLIKNVISLRFLEPPQIFGLLNYTLIEEDQTFRTACKVKGFPQDNFQIASALVNQNPF